MTSQSVTRYNDRTQPKLKTAENIDRPSRQTETKHNDTDKHQIKTEFNKK